MADKLPKFFSSLKNVRVSHVRAVYNTPQIAYSDLMAELRTQEAMLKRIALAEKPNFGNPDTGWIKVKPEQLAGIQSDYIKRMNELQKDLEDPTLEKILAVMLTIAGILAKLAEQETDQDKALKEFEALLEKEITALAKDEAALKELDKTKKELEAEAETWMGWLRQSVTGDQEKVIAVMEKTAAQISATKEAINRYDAAIEKITISDRMMYEFSV